MAIAITAVIAIITITIKCSLELQLIAEQSGAGDDLAKVAFIESIAIVKEVVAN